MGIELFETHVNWTRKAFRHKLERQLGETLYKGKIVPFKEWILKECFGACTNEFEEQTMIENLKEEFENFMKGIKGE